MSKQRVVIVGGGFSGLALAYRLSQQSSDLDITVLERSESVGGTARTELVDGYTIDHGPNGFLTNVNDTWELANEIGLPLQTAASASNKRYIYKDGALHAAPMNPVAFVRSKLLSPRGKLRVLLEPVAGKPPADVDESLYEFAARRLGPEFAEAFIATMVLGITAGDARKVSLKSLFPRMYALERDYGGLVKALLKRRVAKLRGKDPGGSNSGPAGPGGLTTSQQGGVGALCAALADKLQGQVRTGSAVEDLVPADSKGQGWRLHLADGEVLDADAVVLATPAYITAELVAALSPEASRELLAIPYAGVRVLALGMSARDLGRELDGFGFLVAPSADLRIMGCLWTSTIFPSQAPAGKALLRVMAGGVFDPTFVDLSDDEALQEVRRALKTTMGVTAEPELVRQFNWRRAIPQYEVGHAKRVERIRSALGHHAGLFVAGNAYDGIGLNDCARQAKHHAATVADYLRS